jgi:hypothetical protein
MDILTQSPYFEKLEVKNFATFVSNKCIRLRGNFLENVDQDERSIKKAQCK